MKSHACQQINLVRVVCRKGIAMREHHRGGSLWQRQPHHTMSIGIGSSIKHQAQWRTTEKKVGTVLIGKGETLQTQGAEGAQHRFHLLRAWRIKIVGCCTAMIFLAINHLYAVGQGDAVTNPAIEFRCLHSTLTRSHHTCGRKFIFSTTTKQRNAQHKKSKSAKFMAQNRTI